MREKGLSAKTATKWILKMNSMKWVVASIWLVVTAVLCIISYNSGASTAVVATDTIEVVRWDTIVRTQPVVVEQKALGLKSYRVKLLGRIESDQDVTK